MVDERRYISDAAESVATRAAVDQHAHQIGRLERDVHGNGRPGVVADVADLDRRFEVHKTDTDSKFRLIFFVMAVIFSAVVGVIVKLLAGAS
jgi:hypothetical protein